MAGVRPGKLVVGDSDPCAKQPWQWKREPLVSKPDRKRHRPKRDTQRFDAQAREDTFRIATYP